MNRVIKVKTQFVDFHKWESAPEQVKFLRDIHRHVFHVEVIMEVEHHDREVEFFILQGEVNEIINNNVKTLDPTKSCELMAEIILNELYEKYQRKISVEVNEDGECGSIVSN